MPYLFVDDVFIQV